MVDALEAANGRAKGVAFVGDEVTDAELKWMDKAGVRGVRFNFLKRLVDFTPRDVLERIAGGSSSSAGTSSSISRCRICPSSRTSSPRCRPRSWSTTWARPDVAKGVDHPENQRFHRLMEKHKNFWVKVTCPERMSHRRAAL